MTAETNSLLETGDLPPLAEVQRGRSDTGCIQRQLLLPLLLPCIFGILLLAWGSSAAVPTPPRAVRMQRMETNTVPEIGLFVRKSADSKMVCKDVRSSAWIQKNFISTAMGADQVRRPWSVQMTKLLLNLTIGTLFLPGACDSYKHLTNDNVTNLVKTLEHSIGMDHGGWRFLGGDWIKIAHPGHCTRYPLKDSIPFCAQVGFAHPIPLDIGMDARLVSLMDLQAKSSLKSLTTNDLTKQLTKDRICANALKHLFCLSRFPACDVSFLGTPCMMSCMALQVCFEHLQPSLKTSDSQTIKDNCVELCNKPTCGFYNKGCPPKWGLRVGAMNIVGDSFAQCCEPTCELFQCPKNMKPVENPAKVVGSSSKKCCEKTCASSFDCPRGMVKKIEASKITEIHWDTCCTTFGFQAGFNLRTGRGGSCGVFDCPTGYLRADGDVGYSKDACCQVACSAFDCPTGYVRADGAAGIAGHSKHACCQVACSAFDCPTGYVRADGAIAGHSKDACCQVACSAFDCPTGHARVDGATGIAGHSKHACCQVACSAFDCPTGYVRSDGAAGIAGSDSATCCQKGPGKCRSGQIAKKDECVDSCSLHLVECNAHRHMGAKSDPTKIEAKRPYSLHCCDSTNGCTHNCQDSHDQAGRDMNAQLAR